MLRTPITLAVIDDQTLFRKTLTNFLSEQKNISVVIQASDMTELLARLKYTKTDLLLMDLFLPGLSGIEALKILHGEYPDMRILVVSMSTDMDLIGEMLDTGIHGFVSKNDEPDELLNAIQAIADGCIYRNRLFTEALYWNKQHNTRTHADQSRVMVNEREKKILKMIWEEKSNKEIASELFLGVRSVEKIRQDLKEKIGVRSTIGLLKYAIDKKVIHPPVSANRAREERNVFHSH